MYLGRKREFTVILDVFLFHFIAEFSFKNVLFQCYYNVTVLMKIKTFLFSTNFSSLSINKGIFLFCIYNFFVAIDTTFFCKMFGAVFKTKRRLIFIYNLKTKNQMLSLLKKRRQMKKRDVAKTNTSKKKHVDFVTESFLDALSDDVLTDRTEYLRSIFTDWMRKFLSQNHIITLSHYHKYIITFNKNVKVSRFTLLQQSIFLVPLKKY